MATNARQSTTKRLSASTRRKKKQQGGRESIWFAADDREAWLLSHGVIGNFEVQQYLDSKKFRKVAITWRDELWRFLYEPSSSVFGLMWASFVAVLIIGAMVVSAVRSNTDLGDEYQLSLVVLDVAFATVFAVEVVLRCVAVPRVQWIAADALIWLDVLLLIPAFWRAAAYPANPSPLPLACFIEALGPLRCLKVTRYLLAAHLLSEALYNSRPGLTVMLQYYVLVCTVFGSLMYAAETLDGDSDEDQLTIFSAWLEVATLSTVGWVSIDFAPRTASARVVTVLASVIGLPVIALALTVVGNSFNEVWDDRNVEMVRVGLRRLMTKNGISPNDVFTAYSQMDTDSSGGVTFAEFKALLVDKLKLSLSGSDFLDVWHALDADISGVITYGEFISVVFEDIALEYLEDHHKAPEMSHFPQRMLSAEPSIDAGRKCGSTLFGSGRRSLKEGPTVYKQQRQEAGRNSRLIEKSQARDSACAGIIDRGSKPENLAA